MTIIRTFLSILITLAIGAFAILNKQTTSLTFSPLHEPLELPLYILFIGSLAIGFLIGGATVWLNDGKLRREKRIAKRHIRDLEKKIENTNTKSTATDPAAELFPALPSK